MTLPEERSRAQLETRQFLYDLSNETVTPGVPEAVRRHAYRLLRHLASPGELEDILVMALQLSNSERERDACKAKDRAALRHQVLKGLVVLSVGLLVGVLIGRSLPR